MRSRLATVRHFEGEGEPSYAGGGLKGFKLYKHDQPFPLSTGWSLPKFELAYETWGEMSPTRDNVILLHCGLSASSHAHSNAENPARGWWEDFIGSGKALDTDIFHVICTNNIGGCFGSTGPSSINPATGKRYGSSFPRFHVQDQVAAQFKLLSDLGIEKVHASVGASLGGMQSICAGARFPHRVRRIVSISACARSAASSIAFRHCQRQAIMFDHRWNGGDYYDGPLPEDGLKLARKMATVTFRSGKEWEERFGQRKQVKESSTHGVANEMLLEHYISHQGNKWVNNFDPNTLIWISKAMDAFTLEKPDNNGKPCLSAGLRAAQMPALILGVQSDILFPVWQQAEIATHLRRGGNQHVAYFELDSVFGHDTFLLDKVAMAGAIKGHLEQSLEGGEHEFKRPHHIHLSDM